MVDFGPNYLWGQLFFTLCVDHSVTITMIRKYESKDLEVVMSIWRQASTLAHSFLEPLFVLKAEHDLRSIYLLKTETWVYEVNGVIVGFVSMLNNEIGGLFVLPYFQGKGIGSSMVNFVGDLFPELEVEVFERNVIGRGFYEKYGFRLVKIYFHKESNETVRRLNFVRCTSNVSLR